MHRVSLHEHQQLRVAPPSRSPRHFTSALLLLALALPLLLLLLAPTATFAATCARKQKTLTAQCNDLCELYHPCVIIDDALDRDWTCGAEPLSNLSTCVARIVDPCHYECFAVDKRAPNDYTTFAFFVPFGAWRSAQDRQQASDSPWTAQVTALAAVPLNDSVSWKRNDALQRIETLDLPATCTDVVLVGGTTELSVKGKVANVELANDLLQTNTFVTGVRLVNLNLADVAATLTTRLPASQLVALTLTNTLLTAMPSKLSDLKQLQSLDLASNFITAVAAADAIGSQLLHLNLHDNNISRFDASFSKLQTLNLSANALTTIPLEIFAMSTLTTLSLAANPLASLELTTSQLTFLQALASLTLPTTFTNAPTCPTTKQTQLQGFTICVVTNNAAANKPQETVAATAATASSPIAMIGAIAGGVVVVGVIVAFVVVYKRRRKAQTKANRSSSDHTDHQHVKHAPVPYVDDRTPTGSRSTASSKHKQKRGTHVESYSNSNSQSTGGNGTFLSVWNDPALLSVQLRFEDIQDIKQIGSGAFGVVWLVEYRQTQLLASKRLKPGTADRAHTLELVAEIKLVATLEHPHVVRFVGAAWTVESDLQALFEYMDGGDLKSFLLEETTSLHHWTQEKLQVAVGLAEALVYVHSFQPPLVHRDLKARNVLLRWGSDDGNNSEDQNNNTNELIAKLTDFGVSRFRSEDNTMTAGVGTAKWLAPEVIAGAGDYGAAADIYSFGVVLTEIDTHASPFTDARSATGNPLPEIAILQMVASGQLAPAMSATCPSTIKALAMRCLAFVASERPSAVEVAYQLRTIQRNLYTSL